MDKVIVIINQEHIDKSPSYISTTKCPLALALEEQHPELGVPTVGWHISFYSKEAYRGPYIEWSYNTVKWGERVYEAMKNKTITEVELELTKL